MKRRMGFVSNSSSSSFVCDITGETESGWDASLRDCGMAECVAGHVFITADYPEVEKLIEDAGDEESENYDDEIAYGYGIPQKLCPICNGSAKPRIVKRLANEMKRLGITITDLDQWETK